MISHLEKITKEPNRRNCACFVANGVVYTKLKTHANKRQPGGEERITRVKRNIQEDALVHEQSPLEILELIRLNEELERVSGLFHHSVPGTREKRNAEDVSDVLAEIQQSLHSLEDSFRNSSESGPEKCFVLNSGQVNCTASVYEDAKSWKRSRHQIDLLIKVLKKKISDLKDIRKHLKENKPVTVNKEDYEDEVVSKEEDGDEDRKKKEDVGGGGMKVVEDELGPLIDMDWYTTSTTEKLSESANRETTTQSIPTTSARTSPSSTRVPPPSSIIPGRSGRPTAKRPHTRSSTTTTPATTTTEVVTKTAPEQEETKIPIFYIGEEKEELPVKPNVTTEGPDVLKETTVVTETVHTSESTTAPDLEKSVHVETTVFQPNINTKPHRHSHGAHGNRSHHHHHENKRNPDTSAAECYCDFENEK